MTNPGATGLYVFTVREVTSRSVSVRATSWKEARAILRDPPVEIAFMRPGTRIIEYGDAHDLRPPRYVRSHVEKTHV